MLSMKSKYAIRALMVLAANEGKMLQSKVIAKEADAPLKFLETILLDLKNYELVESKRGIFGGYYLRRPASDIMIGEVVRCIDGTLAPIRCASVTSYQKCDDCPDENACAIRHAMIEVRNAISSVLDTRSVASMLTSKPRKPKK